MNLRTGTVVWQALACLLVLGLLAASGQAAVPTMMNYQGYLTDSEGGPRSGAFPMAFAIYADSLGGSALWSEARAEIPVTNGLFSLLLGAGTELPASIFSGATLWLETTVSDTVLAPRRPLVAVPYSFRAALADSAEHVPPGVGDSLWTASGGDVYRLGGNVGIGTASPAGKLDVMGTVQLTGFRLPTGATSGYVLTSDAGGVGRWAAPVGQGAIGGGGTTNNVARFTAPNAIGNSLIWDNGSSIGIGTSSPGALLHLRGSVPSSQALVVQGADGQGANLQEWRHSTGVAMASVSSNGVINGNGFNGNGAGLTNLNASNITSGTFNGNGAGLYNLNASNITSGTLPGAVLYGTYSNPVSFSAPGNSFSGTFTGSGSGLTSLAATQLVGTVPSTSLSGTYNQSVALTNPGSSFTGTFSGSGAGLVGLSASNISFGNLGSGYLPTGGNWALSSNLNISSGLLYLDRANGRIGIGSAIPDSHLDVNGRIEFGTSTRGALLTSTGSDNFQLRTFAASPNPNFEISQGDGTGGTTRAWIRGGTEHLWLLPEGGGFIGVGTTSATNILTVLPAPPGSTNPIASQWLQYSSRRWKEQIVPIEDALGLVQRLQGVRYVLKATGHHDIGMIAEDVGRVLPEVVQFEDNGVDAKGIDYARLTALLVEAVKQLKAENEALSRRVENLERAGR